MNATSALCPSASSPRCVLAPSAMIWPFLTFWPFFTSGRWFWHVLSVVPLNLRKTYSSALSTSTRSASTYVTVPGRSARTTMPLLLATDFSSPVATHGGSAFSSGTACRCMLLPIRARFASSCSRNGISAALTETVCFGEMSTYWIWSPVTLDRSPFTRASCSPSSTAPVAGSTTSGGARIDCISSPARRYCTSPLTLPSFTTR